MNTVFVVQGDKVVLFELEKDSAGAMCIKVNGNKIGGVLPDGRLALNAFPPIPGIQQDADGKIKLFA